MTTRVKIVGALLVLLFVFALGRYSVQEPGSVERVEKIDTEKTTATDTEIVVDKKTDAVATTTETSFRPDGTVEKIVERVDVVRVEEKIVERIVEVEVEKIVYVEREKIVEPVAAPQWLLGLDVGIGHDPLPIPGVAPVPLVVTGRIERRVFGPLWAGVWASSDPAVGVGGHLEF